MEIQQFIKLFVTILLVLGGAAMGVAFYFGKQYQAGGSKREKYICVGCSVASCVCFITAIQVIIMFRNVL